MSPAIMLALHRMGLMYMAIEYRFTPDRHHRRMRRQVQESRAMKRCFAMRLIEEVPITQGYEYEHVRRLME